MKQLVCLVHLVIWFIWLSGKNKTSENGTVESVITKEQASAYPVRREDR
jgi:hypothetical protein